MNISKNLLSLGLIAVISGISTAQTYTATAGTNGTTDIQSDYSMSTGDGASVSVDVPLEFELPKKVAIAVAPNGTKTLPNNPIFEGLTATAWGASTKQNSLFSMTPRSDANNVGNSWVGFVGGIYANTSVSVTVDNTDFIHETDSNSVIKPWYHFSIHKKDDFAVLYGVQGEDNDSSTSNFPYTVNIDDTQLMETGNLLGFFNHAYFYLDTVDPTDRAGKYISISTITVSTL